MDGFWAEEMKVGRKNARRNERMVIGIRSYKGWNAYKMEGKMKKGKRKREKEK